MPSRISTEEEEVLGEYQGEEGGGDQLTLKQVWEFVDKDPLAFLLLRLTQKSSGADIRSVGSPTAFAGTDLEYLNSIERQHIVKRLEEYGFFAQNRNYRSSYALTTKGRLLLLMAEEFATPPSKSLVGGWDLRVGRSRGERIRSVS